MSAIEVIGNNLIKSDIQVSENIQALLNQLLSGQITLTINGNILSYNPGNSVFSIATPPVNSNTITSIVLNYQFNSTVLAANANRKFFTISNEGTGPAIVKLSSLAIQNTNDFSFYLDVGAQYEAPLNWTGAIQAWGTLSSAAAVLIINEYV